MKGLGLMDACSVSRCDHFIRDGVLQTDTENLASTFGNIWHAEKWGSFINNIRNKVTCNYFKRVAAVFQENIEILKVLGHQFAETKGITLLALVAKMCFKTRSRRQNEHESLKGNLKRKMKSQTNKQTNLRINSGFVASELQLQIVKTELACQTPSINLKSM